MASIASHQPGVGRTGPPGDVPSGAAVSGGRPSAASGRPLARELQAGAWLGAIFGLTLLARLAAHDVVITADEDNWMRRSGGFAYGLVNGQLGRTYQNGHPGVTAMWVTTLTLGPQRMVQYADRVHNQRLVARVPGFWDALVDARVGFAVVTAGLVALIAGLAWLLFGRNVGLLAGVVVGLEPFYLAISQLVHMDAILSGCMVASVMAALVAQTGRAGGRHLTPWAARWWVAASGVLAGLAALSKVPAVFLLLFVPLLGLLVRPDRRDDELDTAAERDFREPRPLGLVLRAWLIDMAIWGAAFGVTFVALWPAIWVHGPVEILGRVAEFTRETGGQPHEQGTFFWGQQTADPGPFFYPVALAFRLAPLTVAGLIALLLCWRCLERGTSRTVFGLAAYVVGFLLMMTLGAKKLDRYVLPVVPALGVLAALGLAIGLGALRARPAVRRERRSMLVGTGLGALLLVAAAWPAVSHYPYYLSYYNPLLGGGAAAQRTVMVGNGEGLDQVADWLNARPDAENLWVVSHSFDILQARIVGSGEPLRDRVPSNADYVVLYRFQIQIGHSPRVLDEYLTRHTPEHVVTIDGIEYARIYRGPKQARGAPDRGGVP